MNKTILVLITTMFLLTACAVDIETNQTQEEQNRSIELVFEDENTTIEIVDEQVQVTTTTTETLGQAPIQEWCQTGQVFSMDDPSVQIDSNIIGITTRNGVTVCEASQTQTMELPYLGEVTISTQYFISEDQTEIWAIVDSMGNIEEVYVNLNE